MNTKFIGESPWENVHLGKLLLRLIFGGTLVIAYGFPTFYDLLHGNFEYADPLGIGMGFSKGVVVFAQFFCALLVVSGWKVRWASIPIILVFLVAFFVQHDGDSFAHKELSFLYLGAFLSLFFLGAGQYSLDYVFSKNKH